MSAVKYIVIIGLILLFLYILKNNNSPRKYEIDQIDYIDEPALTTFMAPQLSTNNIETLQNLRPPLPKNVIPGGSASNMFEPYTTKPSDPRYVYVENLGIWLLPYEHLNFSLPYDQWMYYHFPAYYNQYYDNYWPWSSESNENSSGAKYVNSFNDSHWARRQGNRQNRQNAGHHWDKIGGDPDIINGNRWSSFTSEPRNNRGCNA